MNERTRSLSDRAIQTGTFVVDTVTGKRWGVTFCNREGVYLMDDTRDRRMFTWREARARLRAREVDGEYRP